MVEKLPAKRKNSFAASFLFFKIFILSVVVVGKVVNIQSSRITPISCWVFLVFVFPVHCGLNVKNLHLYLQNLENGNPKISSAMIKFICFISIFFTVLSCTPTQNNQASLSIDIWYGKQQQFGNIGLTQKWINILGNVHADQGVEKLTCKLNNAVTKELTVGSDLHRLAGTGDFNIDIEVSLFNEGINQLEIFALDSSGHSITETVEVEVHKGNTWPLPYSIHWSETENIQDVAQVVDGHWEITPDGVRNLDTYYDRVISMGDTSWLNYELITTVIFHGFTPPSKGPPTYNVSHAAIASRWPGHDMDHLQPHRKWFPLGATSEFRLTAGLDSCRWRIFDGPKPDSVKFHVEQDPASYRSIRLNQKYGMKHRVESLQGNRTLYRVKLWPYSDPEPEAWDFEGREPGENLFSGSTLLIAHNTSVTFGDIQVVPIQTKNQ